jgi:hypothetical protein
MEKVAAFEINQEARDRLEAFLRRMAENALTSASSGLVFGVPERWLRRPDKLTQADRETLAWRLA